MYEDELVQLLENLPRLLVVYQVLMGYELKLCIILQLFPVQRYINGCMIGKVWRLTQLIHNIYVEVRVLLVAIILDSLMEEKQDFLQDSKMGASNRVKTTVANWLAKSQESPEKFGG